MIDIVLSIINTYYKEKYNVIPKQNDMIIRINNWYCNTDVTDRYILAAMAIHGDYNCNINYDMMLQITDDYFPNYLNSIKEMEKNLAMEQEYYKEVQYGYADF